MKARQKDTVKYYCDGETKGNWSASLRLAGYSDNYSKVGGYKLLEKGRIKEAIVKERNRIDVENAVTVEVVRANFLEDRQLAKDKGDIGNMVRADENLGKNCGFYGIDNAQKQPQIANIAFIDGTRTAEEVELMLIKRQKELGNAICEG